MNKIYYVISAITLLMIIYGYLPIGSSMEWNDDIGDNFILGHYKHTASADFKVEDETLKSELMNNDTVINEVMLVGNTPDKIFDLEEGGYEIKMSDYILEGKIVGTEEYRGKVYFLFNVEHSYLANYVPRFSGFSDVIFGLFGISLLAFPVFVIVILISLIKKPALALPDE